MLAELDECRLDEPEENVKLTMDLFFQLLKIKAKASKNFNKIVNWPFELSEGLKVLAKSHEVVQDGASFKSFDDEHKSEASSSDRDLGVNYESDRHYYEGVKF